MKKLLKLLINTESNNKYVVKVNSKLIAKQHLLAQSINQSDYLTGHSTVTALLKITDGVKLYLAQNKPTGLVLIDLSAAFVSIAHQ